MSRADNRIRVRDDNNVAQTLRRALVLLERNVDKGFGVVANLAESLSEVMPFNSLASLFSIIASIARALGIGFGYLFDYMLTKYPSAFEPLVSTILGSWIGFSTGAFIGRMMWPSSIIRGELLGQMAGGMLGLVASVPLANVAISPYLTNIADYFTLQVPNQTKSNQLVRSSLLAVMGTGFLYLFLTATTPVGVIMSLYSTLFGSVTASTPIDAVVEPILAQAPGGGTMDFLTRSLSIPFTLLRLLITLVAGIKNPLGVLSGTVEPSALSTASTVLSKLMVNTEESPGTSWNSIVSNIINTAAKVGALIPSTMFSAKGVCLTFMISAVVTIYRLYEQEARPQTQLASLASRAPQSPQISPVPLTTPSVPQSPQQPTTPPKSLLECMSLFLNIMTRLTSIITSNFRTPSNIPSLVSEEMLLIVVQREQYSVCIDLFTKLMQILETLTANPSTTLGVQSPAQDYIREAVIELQNVADNVPQTADTQSLLTTCKEQAQMLSEAIETAPQLYRALELSMNQNQAPSTLWPITPASNELFSSLNLPVQPITSLLTPERDESETSEEGKSQLDTLIQDDVPLGVPLATQTPSRSTITTNPRDYKAAVISNQIEELSVKEKALRKKRRETSTLMSGVNTPRGTSGVKKSQ